VAQIGDPKQLFIHKLGAALTMEETILTMLQELEQKANEAELKEQLSHHRNETHGQVANLEQAFAALGAQTEKQPCPAIEGLEKEGQTLIKQTAEDLVDVVILGAAAETEHHEIAVYDGLITQAEALGEQDVVALLQENLEIEEHTLQEVERSAQQIVPQVLTATA
jgi:ferritin-like metal-binding protein YciE